MTCSLEPIEAGGDYNILYDRELSNASRALRAAPHTWQVHRCRGCPARPVWPPLLL